MTKTRGCGPRRRGARAALAGTGIAVAALLAATTVSAQARTRVNERTDCRCVDRNGEEIPNCTCLRTPGLSSLYLFRDLRGARLGISVSTDQGARADAQGARVESVMDGGPAGEAGIREGDVITRLDGHSLLEPLDSATEADFDLDRSVPVQRLLTITRDIDPGQKVDVEYVRDGETRTATIEARELSGWSLGVGGPGWNAREMADRMRILGDSMRRLRLEMPRGALGLRVWADSAESPRFHVLTNPQAGVYIFRAPDGLDLVELNPKLAEYFGVSGGVLVADVPEDSPLGLEPGDVVLSVGDRKVEGPDHLRRILRSYQPDETITFRIMRHEREMSVQGHLSR